MMIDACYLLTPFSQKHRQDSMTTRCSFFVEEENFLSCIQKNQWRYESFRCNKTVHLKKNIFQERLHSFEERAMFYRKEIIRKEHLTV